jgi:thiamine biosynthesis lipoprotein ApbE
MSRLIRSAPRLLFPALLALFGLNQTSPAARGGEYVFHHENVLGTSLEIRLETETPDAAWQAETRILAEIDRLNAVFSGYDPHSELSQWMRAKSSEHVSRELFEVLKAAQRWQAETEGAFDPRVEVLTRLWTASARKGQIPTDPEIEQALAQLKAPAWVLNEAAQTARRSSTCPISLNAIAKGTIIDRACAAGLGGPDSGVRGALVMIGGDTRVRGKLTRRIGISQPGTRAEARDAYVVVELADAALATSGNAMRGFSIGGKWYSHIFDPTTGRPVSQMVQASVIAPSAEQADALATAFSVMPVSKSLALAESLPGVACLLASADGEVTKSRNWSRFERPQARLASLKRESAPAQEESNAWPKDHELTVSFTIAQPSGDTRRYRRPYVAVWITDKDGVPVRTLVLWIQRTGLRWLPDLSRWYRDDQLRKLVDETDLVPSLSKPTRPAGKYEVVWDGKDDQGKTVSTGTYTLNIEAAREHGTHQIIRKELTIGTKPLKEELKGNVEIKSAAFSYGKRP